MADEYRLMNRFVRPIYDAIDNRQYKVAIKLCAHKKVAHLDIVQVLRAHCLERTGRSDEALEICRAVQKKQPTDETLLNTMSLVFKLSGREQEMLPTYEHACARSEPPNEELFQSLFVAYARKGDFLKQQQTALKMFKAFGKLKYMCWGVLSMAFQVKHAGAPAKMLGLADRMLLKTMRETKSGDGEALQLLVHVLRLQDKHDEALQVFDEFLPLMIEAKAKEKAKSNEGDHVHGENCSHSHSHSHSTAKGRSAEGEGAYDEDIELGPMQAIDRLTLEASLAKTVAQWKRSSAVYKDLLEQYNADDWTYLQEYIGARFHESDDIMAAADGIEAFLSSLTSKAGNESLRGPWLAMVHVQSEKLKQLHGNGSSARAIEAEESVLVERIVGYVERFYTKTCCFTDLQQYFVLFEDATIISPTSKTHLIAVFTAMAEKAKATSVEKDESGRKEALRQLNRRLVCLKAIRFLGVYEDHAKCLVTDLEKLVVSLVREYEASSWLNLGATGGQREVQYTDDLLLLAAHTLIDIYQRQSSRRTLLVEAAALLEYGLEKSAYNFQMKLLLARVYGYLGACGAMLKRHQELDIKHVQLDSLSFLVLDKLLQLGQHTEARRLCEQIRRLHQSTGVDTPEYITRAYRLGVYSKVLDMTSFLRERMETSHTLAVTRGELLQFKLDDALASGSSKLAEFVASDRFQKLIDELDKMLQTAAPLSQNQHREVAVQWTKRPQVAYGDAFTADGSQLVECDRSANAASSAKWLQLQLIVPKLARGLLTIQSGDAISNLTQQYRRLLQELNVIHDAAVGEVKAKLWKWSDAVVTAVGAVASTLDKDDAKASTVVKQLDALHEPLLATRDEMKTALTFHSQTPEIVSLSAYGVSAVSLLLRDAGLWSSVLLGVTLRAVSKKRAKKDDPVVNALRGVLKLLQDVLTSLESHIKALELSSPKDTPLAVVPADAVGVVATQRKVLEQVARSHAATLTHLEELLHHAAASIRAILQK